MISCCASGNLELELLVYLKGNNYKSVYKRGVIKAIKEIKTTIIHIRDYTL